MHKAQTYYNSMHRMEIIMFSNNYHGRLSDYHLHTSFSSDSDNPPENVINKAIKLGLKSICFTDHNDFDYPPENGEILFILDFNNYIDNIARLKEKYSNIIDINIGVEQGLMPSVAKKVNEYDKSSVLDFIIGSSHLIYGEDPYYEEFWQNISAKDGITRYYQGIIDSIKVCNNFDVYGHLDYIIRYAPGKDTAYNWMDYYDYIDTILRMLIENGKGIEINTAGLKYGLKNPNPCPDIIKRYHELGGEIITTGSDAHDTDHVGYRFDIIEDILTGCGFKYYTVFKKRKPEFIRL